MNVRHLSLGLFISVVALTVPSRGAAQTPDEREIRNVQARQADAWNRHDATAYANLFTEDGDVVNVVGWWWKGRSQKGIQLQVLKKSAGKWLIASFQNTSSVPERPFPTGPIAPGASSTPQH
jgi:hypothetical protein